MTYKLNPDVKKITSPVVLVVDGVQQEYPNGMALSEVSFEKQYLVSSLSAQDGKVVISIKENMQINDTSWANGKPVSFFD